MKRRNDRQWSVSVYISFACVFVSQTSRMIDNIDKLKCPYWMRRSPRVLPQRFLRTDRQTKTTHSHTALPLFATTALSTITFQLFKIHTHTKAIFMTAAFPPFHPTFFFFCFPYLLHPETIKPDPF